MYFGVADGHTVSYIQVLSLPSLFFLDFIFSPLNLFHFPIKMHSNPLRDHYPNET